MSKKVHRGQLLKEVIKETQIPISKIAVMLGKSRRTVYNLMEEEHISNFEMAAFGKALGYDFSKKLPELTEFSIIMEPQAEYKIQENYKKKYYDLLEKHVSLIEEMKEKLNAPNDTSASKVRQTRKKK